MSEKCNWDPSKHNGEPCPVHGGNNSQEEWNKADASKLDKMKKEIINKYGAVEGGKIISELNEGKNKSVMSEFDDDYEEEFKDYKIYEDKIREELNKVNSKEKAEYVSDLIDNNMEAGYISEEKADELYNELDKKIDEFSSTGNEDDENKPSGKIDDDFLDNMNDFPAIRKNPKTGEFEVDHDGDGNWSVIDENEYSALKKKGYQEIDYEEEPDAKDDDDLEEGLDELEELVPDSQKNKVKKIKKDLTGDDDKRA